MMGAGNWIVEGGRAKGRCDVKERMWQWYCRARGKLWDICKRMWAWLDLGEVLAGEAGLGKLAITVILLGVGVALTLAVVYVIGPAIINLANRTGEQIESVPFEWGG
jgi:hypothetical protein